MQIKFQECFDPFPLHPVKGQRYAHLSINDARFCRAILLLTVLSCTLLPVKYYQASRDLEGSVRCRMGVVNWRISWDI